MTPEDALALTEAQQLLEDVLANAPAQTEMEKPPRRRRFRQSGTPFLDGVRPSLYLHASMRICSCQLTVITLSFKKKDKHLCGDAGFLMT